jgi:hypothetical protein
MSLNKNETLSNEFKKLSEENNPADTSKSSENSELFNLHKKSLQDQINLSSGLFSEKIIRDSRQMDQKHSGIEFMSGYNLEIQSKVKVLENKILTKIPKFKKYDIAKLMSGNEVKEREKILHNFKTYVYRKKAGLLGNEMNYMPKPRKGNRVVSEGTKKIKMDKSSEVEEWLDDDVFPSNQLFESKKINSLMKKHRESHSRVSSAYFISAPIKKKKIKDSFKENENQLSAKNSDKFSSPLQNFETPNKNIKKKMMSPPSLTRPTWQQNVHKKRSDIDMQFMLVDEKMCPLTPTKWYPNLQKRCLNEIKEIFQDNELSNPQENDLKLDGFADNLPNLNIFAEDNKTFSSPKKNISNKFEIRLDRFDKLFTSDDSIDENVVGKVNSNSQPLKTNSILNPNVISFEANIFDNIISEQASHFHKFDFNLFDSFDDSKSKKSKSSSNENKL